jgi:alkaline phosphatase D
VAKSRRTFLSLAGRGAAGLVFAPAVVRQEASRPSIIGTTAGDVTRNGTVIWGCTDRVARMLVEWSTTESFQKVQRVRGPAATADAGYTARVDLTVPPGEHIFYRVHFEDLGDSRNTSVPVTGRFLSAPRIARDVTFAWSADTVGQGWGINREWGGMRMFDTIRRARPDFFIHCGDTIYADAPLPSELRLPDGKMWKNLVTPAKSKVAETLDEFRGNYHYNLLDEHVRRFNAEVPQFVLWDDHEVKNNWYPGMSLEADDRYTQKDARVLAANGRRAFLEFSPIRIPQGASARSRIHRSASYGPMLDVFGLDLRTYRGANSANRQPAEGAGTQLAGVDQLTWLKNALKDSKATWKVIASDLPIGLVVRDGDAAFEAIANGESGAPLGREHEIADLLAFIRRQRILNIVWVTADVHYAAAHHYHPDRARFKAFHPFWEFVAGPLHAGTGAALPLDGTFGPEVRFVGVPKDLDRLAGPAAGFQFFGMVRIAAATRLLTVDLRNLAGETIYTTDLIPE